MSPSQTPQFIRQEDEPLYPTILYNRPVTRNAAGRMLVVGGHSGEFSVPTAVHQLATAAGIGECRVVLPDNLAKDNPDALIVLTMAEVFKLCGQLQVPIQIRQGAGLINKLEIIQDLKAASRCQYAVYGTEIIVAADTEMVVTPINYRLSMVPTIFYAVLGTFWIQNPTNRRAGLVAGSYVIRQASEHLGATDRPSTGELARTLDQVLRRDEF
jgi:hypothetical protein